MSTPSSSAPDGSDVFSKESQSGTVIIVSAVLTGLSTVVVLLRLYTRQFILNTAGADDWTMGLAQLLSIAAGTSTMLEAHYGLGRHIGTLSQENIVRSSECLFGTIFSYNFGMNVIKVSFLLQYRRIFPSHGLKPTGPEATSLQVIRARQQEDDHGRRREEPLQAKFKGRRVGADDNVAEEDDEVGDIGA
ncbi:hypothetical protein INS49_009926 [Diaporthe citri]|uniref:uncharacterized protein n=1 Tax=Diaporthe citri TaxID=83186 RepID=UPI001C7F075E|nr:uncharacterized protein INS49_009926 [Diaporthe citri]KAG6361698.1 hypothetical protein INS49_009926 [Diaporthe citri]